MAVAARHHFRSQRKTALISQTEHGDALTAQTEVTEAKQVHTYIVSADGGLGTNDPVRWAFRIRRFRNRFGFARIAIVGRGRAQFGIVPEPLRCALLCLRIRCANLVLVRSPRERVVRGWLGVLAHPVS